MRRGAALRRAGERARRLFLSLALQNAGESVLIETVAPLGTLSYPLDSRHHTYDVRTVVAIELAGISYALSQFAHHRAF